MRLIDADALLERWKYGFDHRKSLEECIKTQPTAYDVEKVVEVLDKESVYTDNLDIDVQFVELKEAIDIVRKGGIV